MTITKNVLIEIVMEMTDFKRPEAAKFVEDFFEVIVSALERGDDVKVPGFGNFKLRNKKAREGRNPKTGEPHTISARTVVSFRAGNLLKSDVRNIAKQAPSGTEVA